MVKRYLLSMLCMAVLLAGLSACEKAEETGSSNPLKEVTVYNWGEYIDPEVIDMFEEETGYKVNYRLFTANEEMYTKVVTGAEPYDVIVPSDYMVQRLKEDGLLAEIDFNNIPNYNKIDDVLKNLDYDKRNQYSVPYFWGTVGILYNSKLIDEEPTGWGVFFDPRYKDKILMYDSERDTFMVALTYLGHSMNSQDKDEIKEAKELLIRQKPLVLAYVIDELQDKMVTEEAAIALVWSGQAAIAMEENPDLKFAIPKEPSNLWVDAFAIPRNCRNKEGAEAFINFMCRDDIALKNMLFTGYTSANKEVRKLLDENRANSIASYPPEDYIRRCEVFKYSPENLKYISRAWLEVKQK